VPSLGIVADDLTGALDAAAPFAACGYPTAVALRRGRGDAAVVAASAESRMLAPAAAAARTVALARCLATPALFKKIDSLLRGPLAIEIAALAAARSPALVIVAPAIPAQGRVTIGGVQYAQGRPVHVSVRDPFAPAATSDLAALLAGAGMATRTLTLARVRGGPARVLAELARAHGRAIIADAERQSDLDDLTRAGLALGGDVLWCGAAGLARALAAALPPPPRAPPPSPVPAARALVVCGSLHPASLAQCAYLARQDGVVARTLLTQEQTPRAAMAVARQAVRENRCALLTLAGASEDDRRDRARSLALLEEVARDVRDIPSLGLVATGGDTAAALCRGFGFGYLEVRDVVVDGIPRAVGRGGPSDGMPVVTKAGGFGASTALWDAARSIMEGG